MAERNVALQEHQRRVTIRFGLKVGMFVGVSGADAAAGVPDPFLALVGLSALLCIGLALVNREPLLGRSLGYWDEASWFMLIACLG